MSCVLLSLFCYPAAGTFAGEQSPMPDAVEAVKKVEREFREALLASDTEALGKMLADDFIRTPPTTPATTKPQWLELIRTGKQKYLAFETKEAKYRAYGDTVVVNAVVSLRVRRDAQEAMDLSLRLLQVWVKQGGRWLLVAIQGNQMPAP
jgi:ketosteroid isomerase-like protein